VSSKLKGNEAGEDRAEPERGEAFLKYGNIFNRAI